MNIEHSYSFDPTNGKTLAELLQIQPGKEAPDFRSFWEENYELTMAMRPTYYIEKEMAKQGLDLSVLDYSSIAPCAAAKRAIGTRKGEQET